MEDKLFNASNPNLNFHRVLNGELSEVWPFIEGYIAETVEYSAGRYSVKTIADAILNGFMQLWIVSDESSNVLLAMATQIMNYPTSLKVCDIILLGGKEIEKWLDFTEENISNWASNEMNCNSIQLIGRPAWGKLLKKKGWGTQFVMVEKSLNTRYSNSEIYHG